MKKTSQNLSFSKPNIIPKNSLNFNNGKTTNINILLNRVRLDKKKDFKKKLIFTILVLLGISIVIFFTII